MRVLFLFVLLITLFAFVGANTGLANAGQDHSPSVVSVPGAETSRVATRESACRDQAFLGLFERNARNRPMVRDELVPSSPNHIVLCRYSGENDKPRPSTLQAKAVIARSSVLSRLKRGFNELEPAKTGVQTCPFADESWIEVRAYYRRSHKVVIGVELSGCRFVRPRGADQGYVLSASLLHQLKALL